MTNLTKITLTALTALLTFSTYQTVQLRKEISRSFDTNVQNFDVVTAVPGLGIAALFIPGSNISKSDSGCAITFQAFGRYIVNGSPLCNSDQTNSDVFYSVLDRNNLDLSGGNSISWNY